MCCKNQVKSVVKRERKRERERGGGMQGLFKGAWTPHTIPLITPATPTSVLFLVYQMIIVLVYQSIWQLHYA